MFGSKKTDLSRHYFTLPNEIFHLGLDGGEILIYAYLLYLEDRKTYTCYPSYDTIGAAVGMSRNTVKKYVSGLEKRRLITTEPTQVVLKNGQKRNGNLLYHIRPISEAVEYYDALQMRELEREYARAQAQKRLEAYDKKHPRTIKFRLVLAEDLPSIPENIRSEIIKNSYHFDCTEEIPEMYWMPVN